MMHLRYISHQSLDDTGLQASSQTHQVYACIRDERGIEPNGVVPADHAVCLTGPEVTSRELVQLVHLTDQSLQLRGEPHRTVILVPDV